MTVENKRKNRFQGDPWIRAIAVILLCLVGALEVVAISGWGFLQSMGAYSGTSYLDSRMCKSQIRNQADAIAADYVYGDLSSSTYQDSYSLNHTNVHYSLEVKEGWNQYLMVSSNDKNTGSYDTAYTYYYLTDYSSEHGTTFVQYYETEPKTDTSSAKVYRIHVSVAEPLTAVDDFYYNQQRYLQLYPQRNLIRISMWLLPILFIGILIFLFSSAGKKKDSSEIRGTWVEKIPFEFLFVFSWIVTYLCAEGLRNVLQLNSDSFSGTSYSYSVQAVIGFMMAAGLCILVTMLSAARRIKMHCFWKSTLLYKAYIWLRGYLRTVSIVPKAIILGAVFLMIQWALMKSDRPGLAILADTALVVWLVYCAAITRKIEDAGHQIALGNLDYQIPDIQLYSIFKPYAEDLNSIRTGMKHAVDEQMKSERLKTELITNVSHDIKTPLTSVINYIELFKQDHTPEQEKQYLEVLDRQAQRLKKLTEDVVEASKASSGNISAQLIPVSVREILDQSLAEYQDRLDAGKLTVVQNIPEEPMYVLADGRLLWRVLSNLFSNLCKYAMPDTRVYLEAKEDNNGMTEISVKDISRESLNITADELMQRFVRGDSSRHTEGSGLGLSIAESLIRIMNGTFEISIDGDLFKAVIHLPQSNPPQLPVKAEETLVQEVKTEE